MPELQVQIIAFVDDNQPGWVRCRFVDVFGKEWFITEKVPIVTAEYLDVNSKYPAEGFAGCIIEIDSEVITINTEIPWGISAEGGETIFTVFKNQLE